MSGQTLVRYQQGTLTGEQLESALNIALAEAIHDNTLVHELGLEPAELASFRLTVAEEGGFDPGSILLAIGLALATGAASEAGKILLRVAIEKVRARHGADAVGPQSD